MADELQKQYFLERLRFRQNRNQQLKIKTQV